MLVGTTGRGKSSQDLSFEKASLHFFRTGTRWFHDMFREKPSSLFILCVYKVLKGPD
jgi:hypothetical protein